MIGERQYEIVMGVEKNESVRSDDKEWPFQKRGLSF